jgi:hypothetical protein
MKGEVDVEAVKRQARKGGTLAILESLNELTMRKGRLP